MEIKGYAFQPMERGSRWKRVARFERARQSFGECRAIRAQSNVSRSAARSVVPFIGRSSGRMLARWKSRSRGTVAARGRRLRVKLPATFPRCRSIESYLSMGNNMRSREGQRNERAAREGETASYPNERSQPRLSYADCSEQLDFNADINPLPLNFILRE